MSVDTNLVIAAERLAAIRDHAHKVANGAFRQPGKRERIGALKAALRSLSNTADTGLRALAAYSPGVAAAYAAQLGEQLQETTNKKR
ncbi:hypothetical protein LCGC14_1668270 [marine sediment metagenome]|uniref:Uncharacterized protein n=1 Tax=marine sediment metagenome TaxID=412755 RepID=A0A0F9IEN4_9ZZZZ